MASLRCAVAGLVLALSALACDSLYLPGVAPLDFAKDDVVYFKARGAGRKPRGGDAAHARLRLGHWRPGPAAHATRLQVNSLVSAKSALPIEYYSLPFCR